MKIMFNNKKMKIMMNSLLDNDLYKFSMSYFYLHLFPDAEGEFKFKDRDDRVYTEEFVEEIKMRIKRLPTSFSQDQYKWVVRCIPYIPKFYWDWLLNSFKFNLDNVRVTLTEEGKLDITVTGLMYEATLYEVPILALVSETYFELSGMKVSMDAVEIKTKLDLACALTHQLKFSEFGTRRRFSSAIQSTVCEMITKCPTVYNGTSNVYLSYLNETRPIGTMAHEIIMFHGAIFGYKQANYLTLDNWINTYDGYLGTALTDTYTTDVFFSNLSRLHAKAFDGLRHDSGCPFKFVDKAIKRYQELKIDPKEKTLIFSDGLNFVKYKEIVDYVNGRIKVAAGIGTYLTNTFEDVKAMNIVMKLTRCRINGNKEWEDCVKLSDNPDKANGKASEVDLCKKTLKITENAGTTTLRGTSEGEKLSTSKITAGNFLELTLIDLEKVKVLVTSDINDDRFEVELIELSGSIITLAKRTYTKAHILKAEYLTRNEVKDIYDRMLKMGLLVGDDGLIYRDTPAGTLVAYSMDGQSFSFGQYSGVGKVDGVSEVNYIIPVDKFDPKRLSYCRGTFNLIPMSLGRVKFDFYNDTKYKKD